MNNITILTPTYNRAHLLKRVYDSLCIQSNKFFDWVIIDDGSNDNTKDIISEFIKEEKVKIRYYYKENGGKHTTINYGVNFINSTYVLILDSDDFLTSFSIELLYRMIKKIENNHHLCGIIGLSQNKEKNIIGTRFPYDDWEVSFADVYHKYKVTGDKSVLFKTQILKNFPFPERKNIKFVFEATVWHEMAKQYNVLAINHVIQEKEYLEKGITNTSYKLEYIKGLAFSYFTLIKNETHSFYKYPKVFIWDYIHLAINSLLSKESYFKELNLKSKMLYILFFSRAYFTYHKLKNKLHD